MECGEIRGFLHFVIVDLFGVGRRVKNTIPFFPFRVEMQPSPDFRNATPAPLFRVVLIRGRRP